MFRIENLKRLLRDFLVRQSDEIRDGLSRILLVETVDFFIARIRDFFGVFAHFDLRYDFSVFLDCRQLVHSAEYRMRFCRDQAFAHPEGIDFGAFIDDAADDVLRPENSTPRWNSRDVPPRPAFFAPYWKDM